MAEVRLPRLLTDASKGGLRLAGSGTTVREVFESLFESEPALRPHLFDESGALREHVLVFVDGTRADLGTAVGESSELRVIQAVSGG